MNVYQVSVQPKAVSGAGIQPHIGGSGRTFQIVTGTLQDAMSIARTKITDKEEITGVYVTGQDVVVDYSQVTGQNC